LSVISLSAPASVRRQTHQPRQPQAWQLVFLAEIITTAALEPDAPERNRCGSCVRCLTACPTQAITAPFRLDARRCISYLTIELKGSIRRSFDPPLETASSLRRLPGRFPWNRFAKEGRLMREHARND